LVIFASFLFQNAPLFKIIANIPEDSVLVFRAVMFFVISSFIDAIILFIMSDSENIETSKRIKSFYKLAIFSLFINVTSILVIYVLPYLLHWAF